MVDDVLSSFLVKLVYDQDEKSRKKFDEGLKQVQTRAAEFGAKIDALPAIVSDATKRISASLTEMYYSAQKNGATARELDQLRYAAKQSGEGADEASASFNAFSQRIRDFATGAGKQYKALFGVDVDPNHTMDAFLKVREKIEELRNRGGAQNLSQANLYARTFGIDEDALVSGRLAIFKKAWIEQAKRNEGIAADKAVALTRAYNALAAALETVARKADAALFDKFGAVLDRLTKWLDEDSERIVKFFTNLAAQVGLVFTDLAKLTPAFTLLWDALKEVGGWLQKIIGQPDGNGLAGVRHLLEFIGGVVMARFVVSMAAGFVAAFAPLTALLAGLVALGIIGVGAYTVGEVVGGWLGGGAGVGTMPGGGRGRETSLAGRSGGAGRGGRSHLLGGGTDSGAEAHPQGSAASNIGPAMAAAEEQLRRDGVPEASVHAAAALMIGQALSESPLNPREIHDQGTGYGIYGARDPRNARSHSELRKTKMLEWLAANGYARDSLEGQAKYMVHEAMTDPRFARTRAELMRADEANIGPATHVITPNFEAPGVDNSGARIANVRAALRRLRDAKPLGSDKHSMNQIHDYRSVESNVNIHVADASPRDLATRPLGRPKNADIIRNTSSYAS